MLVTMQNADLIRKLLELAGGDIDLVQAAIRVKAQPGGGGADLQEVVNYIVDQRRAKAAAPVRQPDHA
jgi:ribosomal protein L12E/L44/L45/RPP1/RPP2